MSFTVNLSGGGLLINRFNSSNMLKSTQEKLQRQQERDNKVAFFEAQKENLKNRKADTLEEISEMIVQKQLGYNSKPIVLLNVNRFYDNLIGFFDTIIKENFAKSNAKELYFVASTPEEAVEYLNNYQPKEVSLASKF